MTDVFSLYKGTLRKVSRTISCIPGIKIGEALLFKPGRIIPVVDGELSAEIPDLNFHTIVFVSVKLKKKT